MSSNKLVSLTNNVTPLDNKSTAIVEHQVAEYQVETNIIREVDEANYNQAERTIDALEKANMSTKHALNGLKKGHGYELESYAVIAPVQIKNRQLGETVYGENHLVSYSLKDGIYQVERKDQMLLESGGVSVTASSPSLTSASQSLQTAGQTPNKGRIIEINAISRKTQKQLESSKK